MKSLLLTVALLGASSVASAGTPPVDVTGAMPVAANRITGLWEILTQVGPCGQTPGPAFRNLNVFHAGGTMTGANATPLAGVPTPYGLSQRSPTFGSWRYNRRTNRYQVTGRFYWFVDGVFNGWNAITREIYLSPDGDSFQSTITAERHFLNGTPPEKRCGTELGLRVEAD